MNTYRVWTWILGGLLVITASAWLSMIFHGKKDRLDIPAEHECPGTCRMLAANLEMDSIQYAELSRILAIYKDSSLHLVQTLQLNRSALMQELQTATPDTILINRLTREIGVNQMRLARLASSQYLQIRSICTPEQQVKLSDIFCDLLGCPRTTAHGNRRDCPNSPEQ